MLNKSTEAAIAAMSLLAERYDGGSTVVTATEISESRRLQRPFVAKLLTQLSQRGLVVGTPGRKGGYRLARRPDEISLLDIAHCFERREATVACPFGPNYCGGDAECPLHTDIVRLTEQVDAFLAGTTLDVFHRAANSAEEP